jgi:hypothetical protein
MFSSTIAKLLVHESQSNQSFPSNLYPYQIPFQFNQLYHISNTVYDSLGYSLLFIFKGLRRDFENGIITTYYQFYHTETKTLLVISIDKTKYSIDNTKYAYKFANFTSNKIFEWHVPCTQIDII